MPKQQPDQDLIRLHQAALDEFFRGGVVLTVHCDKCGGLIEVRSLSDSAWAMSCPCGRFKDTLRGL